MLNAWVNYNNHVREFNALISSIGYYIAIEEMKKLEKDKRKFLAGDSIFTGFIFEDIGLSGIKSGQG